MSKKVFIVMVVIALVIAVVPIMIVVFYDDNSSASSIVPNIELKLNTEEEKQKEVKIIATANTTDSKGISSITLPDGSIVNSNSATYTVTENGDYSFSVTGNNGKTAFSEITVSNIFVLSSSNPYIPEGFTYSSGDPENGYTIIDEFENEYIWIPVPTGELLRDTEENSNYEEKDVTVTELIHSVEKYYGFYIAKYESSLYTTSGVSIGATIQNKKPWANVTYSEAEKAALLSSTTFGYSDSKTALMNSYAWDTVLMWIDSTVENYSSNTSFGNYSNEVNLTGSTVTDVINHIADMSGNVSEWTTEVYKGKSDNNLYRVIRGGHFNLNRTAHSHSYKKETTSESTIGFRMILYKTI